MAHLSGKTKVALWVLPIGLLLGLGAYHHLYIEVVEVPEYGPHFQNKLSDYVVPVRKAVKLNTESSPATVRATLREWVDLYEKGALVEVPRLNPYEQERSVPKEAILDAKAKALVHLRRQIARDWESGQEDSAITDTTLGLRFSQIMRTSDLAAYLTHCQFQNELLKMALPYWKSVPASVHAQWFEMLEPAAQKEEISEMVERDTTVLTAHAGNPYRRLRAQQNFWESKAFFNGHSDARVVGSAVKRSPRELVTSLALAKQALTMLRERERLMAPYEATVGKRLVAKSD